MIEVFVESSQYFFKNLIIVYHLPDRMQQVGSFCIHITAAFIVNAIPANDRPVVRYIPAQALAVFVCGFFAFITFNKKNFGIVGKTFMDPHVGNIVGGNIITKPFMTAFMYNDIIPGKSATGA